MVSGTILSAGDMAARARDNIDLITQITPCGKMEKTLHSLLKAAFQVIRDFSPTSKYQIL